MWSKKKMRKIIREASNNLDLDWQKECEERRIRELAEKRFDEEKTILIEKSGTNDPKTLQEILMNRTINKLKETDTELIRLKNREKMFKHGKVKDALTTIGTGILYFLGGVVSTLSIATFLSENPALGIVPALLGVCTTGAGVLTHTSSNINHETKEEIEKNQMVPKILLHICSAPSISNVI